MMSPITLAVLAIGSLAFAQEPYNVVAERMRHELFDKSYRSRTGQPFTDEDAQISNFLDSLRIANERLGVLEYQPTELVPIKKANLVWLVAEVSNSVTSCMDVFGPKGTESSPTYFQDCLKRHFDSDIITPVMKKLFPGKEIKGCRPASKTP